jgi:hypothetical protein
MNNSVAGEQAFSTPPNEIAVYSLTLKVIDWYTLNRNLRFPRSTKAINSNKILREIVKLLRGM